VSIKLLDVSFGYDSYMHLFYHLNLTIPVCCWVTIIGDCGSGKTTLAKLIAGILTPVSGDIIFSWGDGNSQKPEFGYLFQNPDDQFVHFNIEREVAFSLENVGIARDEMFPRVEESLKNANLWNRRNDSPNNLSGGEKQRLALAGMLITEPKVLILDEPTSFLDIIARAELYKVTKELLDEKVSIIWITQEPNEINMSDYVVKLKRGKVSHCGESADYVRRYFPKRNSRFEK